MAFFLDIPAIIAAEERVYAISSSALFLNRPLGKFALQGAAVHVEGTRCRRDIAIMLGEDFLQVFPFQSFH